ncbi:unnamed protein product [Rotaria sordida]|uniref:Uncharacterized protein n=1 Tax=Rotaria sordida TaxID=392033 RepID=A0A815SAW9_9BILA|nr:unnamed protein product [Rotaria sordida]CAF1488118.1 unnamed protein product [Rotaria sordida]
MSALDLAAINKIEDESSSSSIDQQNDDNKKVSIAFPIKIFRILAITDLFELGTIDFRFDVILWNFSNLSACLHLWLYLFISACIGVYCCFHFWAYKRLSFIPIVSSLNTTEKSNKKPTSLLIFDSIWFTFYCLYIGLFLFFPVHYILAENYPIVTRIIILIEQV